MNEILGCGSGIEVFFGMAITGIVLIAISLFTSNVKIK